LEFFLEPIDHLRNLRRRESPARQRIDHAAPPHAGGKAGVRFPGSVQRLRERDFFPLGTALGEGRLDRLAGEAARREFSLEAPRAVALAAGPHRGAGGAEVVEPTFAFEPIDRVVDGGPIETAIAERSGQLRSAARPDREEPQALLARRVGRGGVGRGLLPRVYLPGGT